MKRVDKEAIDKVCLAARLFVACADLEEFDEQMQAHGYTYTGASCTCLDEGERGHHPACGWEKK